MTAHAWHLIGDVGGTNMRLSAVALDGGTIATERHSTSGDHSVPEACAALVRRIGHAPLGIAIAAAGVIRREGAVRLTNSQAAFSVADLAAGCATTNVRLLNDFEAAAWSLATVAAPDVITLQGATVFPRTPRLIFGPGTGLGVGALVFAQGMPIVVPGEGGHVRLAPDTEEQVPIFKALRALWPEIAIGPGLAVEAEALLSGTGLPVLYRAVAAAGGHSAPLGSAADILGAARAGTDPCAQETVALFRQALGGLAGDLGLAFGATGGVFLAGGVAVANPWLFDDAFLRAFNDGGRHSGWRRSLPVHLMKSDDFGLTGARNALTLS